MARCEASTAEAQCGPVQWVGALDTSEMGKIDMSVHCSGAVVH